MRRFAIGSMLVLGLLVGCEKPEEGIPAPEGSTGAVSSGEDLSVEMPKEGAATEGTDGKATDPAAEAKPAEDKPAEDKPAEAKPAEDKPAEAKEEKPAPAAEKPADAPPAESPKQSAVSGASAVKFVADTSIKVPSMSCPHGCWPTVKETLAAQPGVEAVELAKQKDADTIDNPVVYIKLNGKFDAKAAVNALAKAGFTKAEVVN